MQFETESAKADNNNVILGKLGRDHSPSGLTAISGLDGAPQALSWLARARNTLLAPGKTLYWGYFALVMATGIVSIASMQFHLHPLA
ncbi:MAG TPA: hypothetical protein VL147_14455 [Devosia sp.]|nr:hypothetical protein [Devosia sp.]